MENTPAKYLGHIKKEFKHMPFDVDVEVGPNWGQLKKVVFTDGHWIEPVEKAA